MGGKKIRVLVVDDSIVFRQLISKGLSTYQNIEVVATANDPFDARDKIIEYTPDVMTCDIEMPKMNGIEFIKRLLPQYPIPIIVVSTLNHAVLDAMNAGAVEFVNKPNNQIPTTIESFINEIVLKIKAASTAKIDWQRIDKGGIKQITQGSIINSNRDIIAIGASTGGTEAISKLVSTLPKDLPGIVIVQHIPPIFSKMFADRLNQSIPLDVEEGRTGQYLERGKVIIAPGDQHLKIKRINDKYRIDCFPGDKVNGHCPSVDVLFYSVAQEAGDKAIGVILTGMGYDGAKGLLNMKRKGARTIGQDEGTSVVYGMPKVAYDIGAVEKQAPLDRIGSTILYMLKDNK